MDVNGRRPGVASTPAPAAGGPDDWPPGSAALEVYSTAQDADWAAVLAEVARHDFHHLAGYHRLAEHHGEGTGYLFVYRSDAYLVAIPLLLRPIETSDVPGLWDATSVYGYAGPVASAGPIPAAVLEKFKAGLRRELVRRRVVSVFSRLHPLIEQEQLIAGLGEVRACGPTVSVDLTLSEDEQWAGYSKTNRRMIRRAREAGVSCVHDLDLRRLSAWAALYGETMERVGATSSYRYDRAYFERMAAELGPAVHLFVAEVDGDMAAAGLFTECRGIVQAHLGASNVRYAHLSPARVVDDSARRWASEAGAQVLHLGGGVGGREDSLLRYKAGFSDRRHQFSTWRWVVDELAYTELSRRSADAEASATPDCGGYFPAYRRQTAHAASPG